MIGQKYRRKTAVVHAVRYGKDEDGRWYPGSVERVAKFLLNLRPDSEVSQETILSVVGPRTCWSPQEGEAAIDVKLKTHSGDTYWDRLEPGQYVIRDSRGCEYALSSEAFETMYEIV